MPKREDYISWDEYFMGIALLSAMRSKDPNTQVGACIVNQNNKIMSVGYNGLPIGCDDNDFPWARTGSALSDKYDGTDMNVASKRMFEAAGVKLTKMTPTHEELALDFREEDV